MKKIDHIGIAVADLEKAIATYSTLGFTITDTDEVPSQKVRVAFIQIGESRIELLEPMDETSPIAKYIAKKGEGIHHLAIQVNDIAHTLALLKKEGARLIDETPRSGAHGMQIAFVHPKATNGVLLELCQQ